MERWYDYEHYQTLSEKETLKIEEHYDKIYNLMDEISEIYDEIEAIVAVSYTHLEQQYQKYHGSEKIGLERHLSSFSDYGSR